MESKLRQINDLAQRIVIETSKKMFKSHEFV